MAGDFLKRNRHNTAFCFRRRVPDDLRNVIGQNYLVRSLGTAQRSVAVVAARLLAVKSDFLFDQLRTMPSEKTLKEITLEWRLKHAKTEAAEQADARVEEERAKHRKELAQLRTKAREAVLKAHILGGLRNSAATGIKPPNEPGMPFAEALTEYLDHQRKATTANTYRGRLKHAQEFFGADRDIRYIEQADFAKYAKYAYTTIPNESTAGLHIQTACGMFNHFRVTLGWGAKLTSEKLIKKKTTPDFEERDAFTIEQLRMMFLNAAKYRTKEPHMFWVTIAVPFLGCRIEELAQISLRDDLLFNQKGQIWYIKIHEKLEADGSKKRSVKNLQSWRHVPIHTALVRHGFVDYLLQQRDKGFTRPFESGWGPLIPKGRANPEPKYSHYISGWGGRELKKLRRLEGFGGEGVKLSYFHSTRHSFSKLMRDAGVSPEGTEALLGHAYGGRERERYNKLKQDECYSSSEVVEKGLGELVMLLDALPSP